MLRKLTVLLGFAAALGVCVGCGGSSSPAVKNAPISTKDGSDKKGHKTKSMEASIEDPAAK
jgi:hypothetical protein